MRQSGCETWNLRQAAHPSSRSRRSAVLELFYPSLFGCSTFFSTHRLFRLDERGEPATSCERGQVRQQEEWREKGLGNSTSYLFGIDTTGRPFCPLSRSWVLLSSVVAECTLSGARASLPRSSATRPQQRCSNPSEPRSASSRPGTACTRHSRWPIRTLQKRGSSARRSRTRCRGPSRVLLNRAKGPGRDSTRPS